MAVFEWYLKLEAISGSIFHFYDYGRKGRMKFRQILFWWRFSSPNCRTCPTSSRVIWIPCLERKIRSRLKMWTKHTAVLSLEDIQLNISYMIPRLKLCWSRDFKRSCKITLWNDWGSHHALYSQQRDHSTSEWQWGPVVTVDTFSFEQKPDNTRLNLTVAQW